MRKELQGQGNRPMSTQITDAKARFAPEYTHKIMKLQASRSQIQEISTNFRSDMVLNLFRGSQKYSRTIGSILSCPGLHTSGYLQKSEFGAQTAVSGPFRLDLFEI